MPAVFSKMSKDNYMLDEKSMTDEHKKELRVARKCFMVETMLGRPTKKFNLLINNDEGQLLKCSDDITHILTKLSLLWMEHGDKCCGWNIMFAMKASVVKDNDRNFFMFCNVGTEPLKYDGVSIEPFMYYTWSQGK